MRPFIPALIIATGIWAYHNSLIVPFLFDDHASVEDNLSIRHLWPIREVLSPPATSGAGGRPVVDLSLAVNYALGGLAVRGYPALNMAVHLLAALTLYGILRRTLSRPGLRERFGTSGEWVALAVAMVWMVHPLQTEAVTYISQRCESLMGLFYLLTLYGFIRGVESRGSGPWFVLSVVACFLGMGSKEVMVTAPLMVLLYDRAFISGSFREAWHRHWRVYLGLAGGWLLLGYLMVGLHNRNVGYGLGITWWGYALTECQAVVLYTRLAFWPHPLIFDYGYYAPTRHLVAVAAYGLILAVLITGVLLALKWQPAFGFLGAWVLVILSPTSSVVPIVGSPVAEHRMYLPLAAVVTMVMVGAFQIGKRLLSKPQGLAIGCVAGGFVAALFSFLTIQRNRDYSSELTIWQDTVEKRPNNFRAHYNLGRTLVQLGKRQEAIGHYEQALRLEPDFVGAHYNLGVTLMGQGRLQEAIGHYEQALRLKPDYAEAHYNLGIALHQQGRTREAVEQFEQALRIKPDYAEAHNNLGNTLRELGRPQEAISHYVQALQIKPEYAEAHNNLGNALRELGQPQDAISHYEQALRITPDDARVHNNLGNVLMQVGRQPEGMEHLEQALRIDPNLAETHYNLGLALDKLGRTQEAIQHYEQALRIKPDFVQAQNALARARAGQ